MADQPSRYERQSWKLFRDRLRTRNIPRCQHDQCFRLAINDLYNKYLHSLTCFKNVALAHNIANPLIAPSITRYIGSKRTPAFSCGRHSWKRPNVHGAYLPAASICKYPFCLIYYAYTFTLRSWTETCWVNSPVTQKTRSIYVSAIVPETIVLLC